jgi:uridine phosphorylase
MGWEEAQERVNHLRSWLNLSKRRPVTAESICGALRELRQAIENELASRKFVMIENDKLDFFEQENLFGKQVAKAFPLARNEIRSAGNCLAMDLNTAAVFHLMRVRRVFESMTSGAV